MSFFTSVWKFLWLTEEDPSDRDLLIWRITVSSFMSLIVLFVVFTLGGIWKLDGFAFASEIDDKIEVAIEPITERLTTIEDEQTVQGGYLRRLVKSDLERLIDREVLARCNATTSPEKRRIKDAIDAYQSDYKAVFGAEYLEPRCEDL